MRLFYKNIAKNSILAAGRPVNIGERAIGTCTVTLSLQLGQRKLYLARQPISQGRESNKAFCPLYDQRISRKILH